MSNCITDIKTIHRFLNLTGGNWRNSIYIECKECKYKRNENCGDFLCVPDENGELVLLPICDCNILFARYIDPSECLLWISRPMFREIYKAWWGRNESEMKCPFWRDIEQKKREE